mgnify:CR=1 FL=1
MEEDEHYLFTSESVAPAHPDKMADAISDAVLDACLEEDPHSRVACEVMTTTGLIVISGEITSDATIDYDELARETVRDIGYTSSEMGFDADSCGVMVSIGKQSPDIAQGVDADDEDGEDQGAGDQGMMVGFACNETPQLMPLPILLSHQIMERLTKVRKNGDLPYLRPDGKCQVTIEYEGYTPVAVDTVVLSSQHSPDVTVKDMKPDLIEQVIRPCLPDEYMDTDIDYLINPTGKFVIGGPKGDCGLTGRKVIVDTYGGRGRHGGGAFSGKDPSKVDRSAAYATRYVAKNVVAAGLADICEVQVAYAIGVAEPVSIHVETDGTNKIPEHEIRNLVQECFDLTPRGIIENLDLLRPIYSKTSGYGHFGHEDPEFTWEKTDKADTLREKANL